MATRTVRIEVTAEDISNGIPCQSGNCPVALASSRALGFSHGRVGVSRFSLYFDGRRFPFGDSVTERIRRYDDRLGMDPFSFFVEVPSEAL